MANPAVATASRDRARKSVHDPGEEGNGCNLLPFADGRRMEIVINSARNMANALGTAQPQATTWSLFHFNRDAWPEVLELCSGARSEISIEQYIYSRHGIGADLLDVLTDKARQGVRVRILADAFGSKYLFMSDKLQGLLRAGGEVCHFHGRQTLFRHPERLFNRLHRKSVICDNASLLTGGTCFLPRMADWRDTMVRIDGEVARQAARVFEETWRYAQGAMALPNDPNSESPAEQAGAWRYLISSPYPLDRENYIDFLLRRVENARKTISFTTPYLLPVRRYRKALSAAVERGVKVRLIMPVRSDHRLVDLVGRFFARSMKRTGVEVYGYERTMLHAKIALFDEEFSAVGSFNLGVDSFKMNLEGAVVTACPRFAMSLSEQIDKDLAQSRLL